MHSATKLVSTPTSSCSPASGLGTQPANGRGPATLWRSAADLTDFLYQRLRDYCTPWSALDIWTDLNSTFIKAIAKLEREGKFGAGLTFHVLRHTVGTLLVEAGVSLDTVRRWLGQKTLTMAIHYSETADTSKQMRGVLKKFDPLGSKTRT